MCNRSVQSIILLILQTVHEDETPNQSLVSIHDTRGGHCRQIDRCLLRATVVYRCWMLRMHASVRCQVCRCFVASTIPTTIVSSAIIARRQFCHSSLPLSFLCPLCPKVIANAKDGNETNQKCDKGNSLQEKRSNNERRYEGEKEQSMTYSLHSEEKLERPRRLGPRAPW